MIIVKYSGGLGNQMFQYAMHFALQKKYKNQEVKGEKFHYLVTPEHNGFELEKIFDIDINWATQEELREFPIICKIVSPRNNINKIILKINKFIKKITSRKKIIYDDEKFNNYVDKIDNLNTGKWYLDGFWQRTDYFEDYRNDIIKVFNLKCTISPEEIDIVNKLKNGEIIAIHVRGGDFINPKHNLCNGEYYEQAIKEINKENLPMVVFTDDKEYAKKILGKFNIIKYISHGVLNSKIDMYMLSMSKKVIISNSTFAFWGVYLSNINEQKVICPKYATYDGKDYRKFPKREFWKDLDNSKKEGII